MFCFKIVFKQILLGLQRQSSIFFNTDTTPSMTIIPLGAYFPPGWSLGFWCSADCTQISGVGIQRKKVFTFIIVLLLFLVLYYLYYFRRFQPVYLKSKNKMRLFSVRMIAHKSGAGSGFKEKTSSLPTSYLGFSSFFSISKCCNQSDKEQRWTIQFFRNENPSKAFKFLNSKAKQKMAES